MSLFTPVFLNCFLSGWAEKKGFLTAKAARKDAYRAANHILRLTVEGRICLSFRPPEYTTNKKIWESDPETQAIAQQQTEQIKRNALNLQEEDDDNSEEAEKDDEDEDEDEEDIANNESKFREINRPETKFENTNPFSLLQDE